MRILLTNHTIRTRGGTETWTLTMARAFEALGHEVELATGDGSSLPEFILPYSGGRYDLSIINHLHPANTPGNFKVYTSHGVIPSEEVPKPGADAYVAVSEEVLNTQPWPPGSMVSLARQPLDLYEFQQGPACNSTLRNVLVMSNNADLRHIYDEAFPDCFVRYAGRPYGNQIEDPKEMMLWADLVVTLGRGALEAALLGRNVLISDHHGTDGMLTYESYPHLKLCNFSGRRNAFRLSPSDLRTVVDSLYTPVPSVRPIITANHDSRDIARRYLDLKETFG